MAGENETDERAEGGRGAGVSLLPLTSGRQLPLLAARLSLSRRTHLGRFLLALPAPLLLALLSLARLALPPCPHLGVDALLLPLLRLSLEGKGHTVATSFKSVRVRSRPAYQAGRTAAGEGGRRTFSRSSFCFASFSATWRAASATAFACDALAACALSVL